MPVRAAKERLTRRPHQRLPAPPPAAGVSACATGRHLTEPAWPLTALALALLGLVPAAAVSQIRADPAAPLQERPTVRVAPNGVPLVHIQTPSAAGVSRNTYRQFDVTGQGAILNNSRVTTPTQLGGWVEGNPWLARGSARVILNEVRSADPSQLRGPIEVAGARAELVIANPAGIRVDGAGFINASQVTLTTGTPRLIDGRLDGFQVQQGTVAIEGKGLDARDTDYTRILARALRLNAGLWGRDVQVIAGVNDIRADASALPQALHATTVTPAAPEVAIDVSRLGGMYAGKIRLVGTEAGVGVRQHGTLSASGGDLVIDHQGWLSLGGQTQSNASVHIAAAGDITHGGVTVAQQTLSMSTPAHLLNTGSIAGGRLDIEAGSLTNAAGAPQGGDIWQTGTQDLVVQAGSLRSSAQGRIGAIADRAPAQAGRVQDASTPPGPDAGAVSAPDAASPAVSPRAQAGLATEALPAGRLVVHGLLDNADGTLGGQGAIDLRVLEGLDNAGELVVRHAQVDGGRFANRGVLLAQRHLDIRVDTLEAVGILASGGDLSLSVAQPLAVADGERVLARGNLRLDLEGADLVNAGQLQAGQALAVSAGSIDNQASGDIDAATTRIQAGRTLTNRGMIDGERTEIAAADVRNIGTGRVFGDDIAIAAVMLLNDSETSGGVTTAATIAARRRLDIGARHLTNREDALIFSAGSLHVGGALDEQGRAIGEAETLDNQSATIESLGDMRLAARTLRNTNAHFETELRVVSGPTAMTLIQPQGSSVRIAEGNLYRAYWDRAWDYRYDTTPDPHHGVPPQLGATPIPALGEARCADPAQPSTCARIPGADYLPDDPAWAYFGLTPPPAAPAAPALAEPVPPAEPEQSQRPDPAWDLYRAQRAAYDHAWQQYAAEHARWDTQSEQAYAQLDARIDVYNQQFQGAAIREWTQYNVQRTILQSQVTRSAPGQILAGGALELAGSSIVNDKSRIIAGGRLSGDLHNLHNAPAQGQRVEQESGTTQSSWIYTRRGGKLRTGSRHSYRDFSSPSPYAPADTVTTIGLNVGEVQAYRAPGSAHHAPAASAPDLDMGRAGSSPNAGESPIVVSSSSLFRVNPDSTTGYLVETDPRFTDYRLWLGSDYLLRASGHDPATVLRRLGDGFHEQRLVREQVAALTGHRFLGDWHSDEAQYLALMSAGATFAHAHQLRPGVGLSASQVAQLTADIVWLVEQPVILPDGRPTTALVPRVYLAPRAGDLAGDGQLFGSVISGRDVQLRLQGALDNGGSIAGRQLVRLDAANLRNPGQVQGAVVDASAQADITLEGGRMQAQDVLVLRAGQDLRVASTTHTGQAQAGANRFSGTAIDRVAGLYVSGNAGVLVASAGRDAVLQAAVIDNQGLGPTALQAGRDLTLATVTTASSQDIHWTASNYLTQSRSQEQGSRVHGAGDVDLRAGHAVHARAAEVQAQGHLAVTAGGAVTLQAGQAAEALAEGREIRSRGMWSRSTTVTRTSASSTQAVASELGGQAVSVRSGQDITVQGSRVIADQDTRLEAGRDANLLAQQTTRSESSFEQTTRSGLFSNGGLSVTLGTQAQSLDQQQALATAAASTVGSISGDVRIAAGRNYQQTGSDVLAPGGDIGIHAQRVDIVEARESATERVEQRMRQSGLTVAVTNPVLDSVQAARAQVQAAGHTRSDRMRLLAGASAVMNASQAVDAVRAGQGDANSADRVGGIGIGISVGNSSSQSVQSASAQTARGSRVEAGGQVHITASGAGTGSDLTLQGSDARAAGVAALVAEDEVRLLAATDSREQRSSQSSSSASVGVAVQWGHGGGGIGVTASASRGTGQGQGSGTRHVNSHVEGDEVVIASGGDTTLRGAVVSGRQVTAVVSGDLVIESLQDTDRYQERSQQVAGSVMIGAGGSGTVSAGRTRIDSDYRSVGEQSAVRAGDGGFQVQVGGDTTLVGGQVTSTQEAVEAGRNRFDGGGRVTAADLENRARYEAQALAAGVGGAVLPGQGVKGALTGAGTGQDSGQAASTTTAGISGVAGDAAARTGDAPSGLGRIFDAQAVQQEIEAQVTITREFGRQAGQVVKDYAGVQRQMLREQVSQANTPEARQAAEDQLARVNLEERVLNILVGAVTGMGASAVAKESLDAAADQMRELMIEQSRVFPGVMGSDGRVLSNVSGASDGIDQDGIKLGGTRVDLDLLCGANNKRCVRQQDASGNDVLDASGRPVLALRSGVVQFLGDLDEFMLTPEGRKMPGATGGIQGVKGTLFGRPYEAGSWADKLIEAFAGPHDYIGGYLSGLYDHQGNIRREMSDSQRSVYDRWVTTTAIPVAAPFAAAQGLPPDVWRAISVFLRLAK